MTHTEFGPNFVEPRFNSGVLTLILVSFYLGITVFDFLTTFFCLFLVGVCREFRDFFSGLPKIGGIFIFFGLTFVAFMSGA